MIGAALYAVNGTNINARQIFGVEARLAYHVGQASSSRASLLVVICVHLCEMLPLLGEIVFGEDRLDGASRLTRAAIDAFVRVDIEQLCGFKCRLVFARVNAVYRTDVHASRVLGPYAGFSDNIRH